MNDLFKALRKRLPFLNRSADDDAQAGLGTFNGVFLPAILTIFGVIMYLRMGVIIGSVGLIPALSIILLALTIIFITALSISATATNMHVGAGGAYYMISRSFGKEIGSAVGMPLALAQAVGIAFYISGFSEAVHVLIPTVSLKVISLSVLALLSLVAYRSSMLVVRSQLFIFIVILASLASIFSGGSLDVENIELIKKVPRLGFWAAFALFFPAVTGIEAGVALSGDLKKPSRSIPIGIIASVIVGGIVYVAIAVFLSKHATKQQLLKDPQIVRHMAYASSLVFAGICGATLSSALGAILGAPRTMQALAEDGALPRVLAKGYGVMNEPRLATLVSCLIAAACLSAGSIDVIAPVLTMFFLVSYCALNLGAGLEGVMGNPSWRPTFKVSPWTSLLGALMCVLAMLMIDAGATVVACGLAALIYVHQMRKQLSHDWFDIRQGILFYFSRMAVYRLATTQSSPRCWRPHFLVLTRGYSVPNRLIKFTSQITHGRGLLTIASLFDTGKMNVNLEQARKRILEVFKKRDVQALVEVDGVEDFDTGVANRVRYYGLGPLTPNSVVVEDRGEALSADSIPRLVQTVAAHDKNIIVFRGQGEHTLLDQGSDDETVVVDIWWDEHRRQNSEMMIALAHMHQATRGAKAMQICLKSIVDDEAARTQRSDYLREFFSRCRLKVKTKVYVAAERGLEAQRLIPQFSADADLVLIGLPVPNPEATEDYNTTYRTFVRCHKSLGSIAYVHAGERIDLDAIFR